MCALEYFEEYNFEAEYKLCALRWGEKYLTVFAYKIMLVAITRLIQEIFLSCCNSYFQFQYIVYVEFSYFQFFLFVLFNRL